MTFGPGCWPLNVPIRRLIDFIGGRNSVFGGLFNVQFYYYQIIYNLINCSGFFKLRLDWIVINVYAVFYKIIALIASAASEVKNDRFSQDLSQIAQQLGRYLYEMPVCDHPNQLFTFDNQQAIGLFLDHHRYSIRDTCFGGNRNRVFVH